MVASGRPMRPAPGLGAPHPPGAPSMSGGGPRRLVDSTGPEGPARACVEPGSGQDAGAHPEPDAHPPVAACSRCTTAVKSRWSVDAGPWTAASDSGRAFVTSVRRNVRRCGSSPPIPGTRRAPTSAVVVDRPVPDMADEPRVADRHLDAAGSRRLRSVGPRADPRI